MAYTPEAHDKALGLATPDVDEVWNMYDSPVIKWPCTDDGESVF